jgi:putative transposase
MQINRAIQIKLDPTREQEQALIRRLGVARFLYNFLVEYSEFVYKRDKELEEELGRKLERDEGLRIRYGAQAGRTAYKAITAIKRGDRSYLGIQAGQEIPEYWRILARIAEPEWRGFDWIDESGLPASAYSYISNACGKAYEAWFSAMKKGGTAGRPRRHRMEHYRGAYTVQLKGAFSTGVKSDHINLANLGHVKMRETIADRIAKLGVESCTLCYVTVSRDPYGFSASVTVKYEAPEPVKPEGPSVGLDFGVKQWATLSDGRTFDLHASIAKLERKQKRLARSMSRKAEQAKKDGRKLQESKSYRATRLRHARVHETISRFREDQAHKLSKVLADNHARVVVEDLRVRGMTASAKGTAEDPGTNVRAKSGLNRAILRGAPFGLRSKIEYKCKWSGAEFIKASTWYPSSKTCSACGTINRALKLRDRVFRCPECGHTEDRDLNAAKNLANYDESSFVRPGGAHPVVPESERAQVSKGRSAKPRKPRASKARLGVVEATPESPERSPKASMVGASPKQEQKARKARGPQRETTRAAAAGAKRRKVGPKGSTGGPSQQGNLW